MLGSKNDPFNMYANEKGFIIPVMILCLMTIVIIAMFGMVVVVVIMMYHVISEDDVIIQKRKKKTEEKESANENEVNDGGEPKVFNQRRRFNQGKMNKLVDTLINSNKMFFMIVIFLMACILLHATVTAMDSLTEAINFIKDDGKTVVGGKEGKM